MKKIIVALDTVLIILVVFLMVVVCRGYVMTQLSSLCVLASLGVCIVKDLIFDYTDYKENPN